MWEIIDLDQRVNYPMLYPVDTCMLVREKTYDMVAKARNEKFNFLYTMLKTESEGEFIEKLPNERIKIF